MHGVDGSLFTQRTGYENERNSRAGLVRKGQGGQAVVGWQLIIGQNQVQRRIFERGFELRLRPDTLDVELDALPPQFAHLQFGVARIVLQHEDLNLILGVHAHPFLWAARSKTLRPH